MPELPEVETIRRQMEHELVGARIKSVDITFAKRLNLPAKKFAARLTGARFTGFRRRAKLLLADLDNGYTLITHLKMTGKYLLHKKPPVAREKHVHLAFHLTDGRELWFKDVRKFGYLKLVPTSDVETKILRPENYGPEPLAPDFTAPQFAACLRAHPKKRVKPLLLEQTCIAGIGNIYGDESLWHARIRPTRRVSTLKTAELEALYNGVRATMNESLARRGTSDVDFLDLYGQKGENQLHLNAYGEEKCARCHTAIKAIKLGSRTAHYCPQCQK